MELNCRKDLFINSLTFAKFFDFCRCFHYSLMGYGAWSHHEFHTISLYHLSKCLREKVRIGEKCPIFSYVLSPFVSLVNNLKSVCIKESTCSSITQNNSFIIHTLFIFHYQIFIFSDSPSTHFSFVIIHEEKHFPYFMDHNSRRIKNI